MGGGRRAFHHFLVAVHVLREHAVGAPEQAEPAGDRSSGVIARIGTAGRLRAMRAAVVPLEVKATMALAPIGCGEVGGGGRHRVRRRLLLASGSEAG